MLLYIFFIKLPWQLTEINSKKINKYINKASYIEI